MHERTLDVNIPKGIRAGQHLRLVGQGGPGIGAAPAGDLFLEIEFEPHRLYRVDGRDVYVDLPLAPWEAGARPRASNAPTPEGTVQLHPFHPARRPGAAAAQGPRHSRRRAERHATAICMRC